MQSKATTVAAYLAELPPERRAALQAVREVILKNLDRGRDGKSGFVEGMGYGMMGYSVPHTIYPAGYHCDPRQPLPFAGLASQKNHMSVYMMCLYQNAAEEAAFRSDWAKTGKKLDMGKCCIRFKKLDDVALDVIGRAIRRVTVKKYIATYEAALASRGGLTKPKKKAGTAKPRGVKPARSKAASAKR